MENKKSKGLGLSGMVFIVFLILKLAGVGTVATWSWLWVTSPLWIGPVLAVIVIGLIGLALIIKKVNKKVV